MIIVDSPPPPPPPPVIIVVVIYCFFTLFLFWRHCRVPWGEALLSLGPTQQEQSLTTGEILLRGLLARVGIFHGPITGLCPHAITGHTFACHPSLFAHS